MRYVTGSRSHQCGCGGREHFALFLGVCNLNANFLAKHFAHITSLLRSAPMNLLFAFWVTASTSCGVLMTQRAVSCGDDTFNAAGYSLLATMMVVAILEHWFQVLPIISATCIRHAMWQWSLVSRGGSTKASQAHQGPLPIPTEATIGGHT